jgi:hypothetical protein
MIEWIKIEKKQPSPGKQVLVVKHYMDQEFDMKLGGYGGPLFATPAFITIDVCDRDFRWVRGGIVTEWMELPEMPERK